MQSIVPPNKKFKQALLSFSPNRSSSGEDHSSEKYVKNSPRVPSHGMQLSQNSPRSSDHKLGRGGHTTSCETSASYENASSHSENGRERSDRLASRDADDIMEVDIENKENSNFVPKNESRDGGVTCDSVNSCSSDIGPGTSGSLNSGTSPYDGVPCVENPFSGFSQSDLNLVKEIESKRKVLSEFPPDNQSDPDDVKLDESEGAFSDVCSGEEQTSPNQTTLDVSTSEGMISLSDADSPTTSSQSHRRSANGLSAKMERRRQIREQKRKRIEELKEAKRLERQRFRDLAQQKKLIEKQELLEKRKEIQRKKEEEKIEKLRLKEVEKQAKDKEREDKRKKKDEEKQIKEQAKQIKDEERRLKEEEKRREEDDKARKMAKARSLFNSFFAKPQVTESFSETDVGNIGASTFMQFRVKECMAVAPIVRRRLEEKQLVLLDQLLTGDDTVPVSRLYLHQLREKTVIPLSDSSTVPRSIKEAELMDDEDGEESVCEVDTAGTPLYCRTGENQVRCRGPRYKLLQFWENRRPSYWGTWRRRSATVFARRPFAKDQLLSYDEDSDDDWEAEDPDGESLGGSEKEIESEDDYEVDNDFFVPHGYLSDEEVKDDREMMSPDTQKALLKAKGEEFEKQMKKKTKALKPRSIGCIWTGVSGDSVYEQIVRMLSHFTIISFAPLPLDICGEERSYDDSSSPAPSSDADSSRNSKFSKEFPVEGLCFFVQLLHGSVRNKKSLIREFSTFWNQRSSKVSSAESNTENSTAKLSSDCCSPTSEMNVSSSGANSETGPRPAVLSDRLIDKKLTEIASYSRCTDEGPLQNRCCWLVHPSVINELGLSLSLPNQWVWITSSVKTPRTEDLANSERNSPTPSVSKSDKFKKRRLITTYTKLLSPKDRQEDSSNHDSDPEQLMKCSVTMPIVLPKADSSSSSAKENKPDDSDSSVHKDVVVVNESNFKITNFFKRAAETNKSAEEVIDLTEDSSTSTVDAI